MTGRRQDGVVYGLTEEQAAGMPIDRLAMHLLMNLEDDVWNSRNWVLERREWNGLHDRSAAKAWVEAWAWLHQQGLIIPNFAQTAPHAVEFSREGLRLRELGDASRALGAITAGQRLQRDLYPQLERARSYFLAGDYDVAAFAAMREVEVAVREAGLYPDSMVGTKLIRAAEKDGVLAIEGEVQAERQARAHLFAGAIGLFKNPSSHRPVDYDDPAVAAEIIVLADLLLRLVDEVLS